MGLYQGGEDEKGGYGSLDVHASGRTALLLGGEKEDQENQGRDQNQKIGHSYKRRHRPCKACWAKRDSHPGQTPRTKMDKAQTHRVIFTPVPTEAPQAETA